MDRDNWIYGNLRDLYAQSQRLKCNLFYVDMHSRFIQVKLKEFNFMWTIKTIAFLISIVPRTHVNGLWVQSLMMFAEEDYM